MALKDTAIRNAKPKDKLYRLRVDEGLYIEITPHCGASGIKNP